jgi:hypothetical protein
MTVIAMTQAIKPQINIAPYFIGLVFLDSARSVVSTVLTKADANLNERIKRAGHARGETEAGEGIPKGYSTLSI